MTTLWLGLVVVMATRWLTAHSAAPHVRYRAAVYEHVVQLPLPPASTRAGAVQQMQRNLDVFRQQAAAAKAQGAQLVVFPEDGVYGMALSRDQIRPFLETVPDPRSGDVNPCQQRAPYTEVQTALSCMARDLHIHVVANMGDRQPCQAFADWPCPPDKAWQFNTGVAFGPDGRLLARYHKVNLYGETQFDTPPPDPYNDAVVFNTTFGVRFGLATCFDLLFRTPPVDLVEKHGIRDLTFPTAWMDSLPLLPAVGFHSGFARGLGVTVLAANIHLPLYRMHGSGVYGARGATAFYSNADPGSSGGLVVADVLSDGSVRPLPPPGSGGNHSLGRQEPLPGSGTSALNQLSHKQMQGRRSISEEYLQRRSPDRLHSLDILPNLKENILSDFPSRSSKNYSLAPLNGTSGHRQACYQDVCCSVDFKFALEHGKSRASELYALGAWAGLEGSKGTRRFVEVCLVMKCLSDSLDSCGLPVTTALTRLQSLRLQGNFSTGYVFPELVVDQGGQLSPAPGLWDFTAGAILGTDRLSESPLVNAVLYGRVYEKDVPPSP